MDAGEIYTMLFHRRSKTMFKESLNILFNISLFAVFLLIEGYSVSHKTMRGSVVQWLRMRDISLSARTMG